jgi:flavodoxin I
LESYFIELDSLFVPLGYNQNMAKQLCCIYASTSGNVEITLEKVAEKVRVAGWEVTLHRAEQASVDLFQQYDYFLLATSTWEHGVLNPFFAKLHEEMQTLDFTGKQAIGLGLGDTRYEQVYFCRGIDILLETWQKQHGEILYQALKLNGDPYPLLRTMVNTWAEHLVAALPAV